MRKGRVLIDEPASGAWNMAVDHALLETANLTGLVSVRFYAWSQPTLSLGYFQQQAHRQQHQASLSCPQVRRSTGGGAIIHDQEITYSLCVPSNQRWSTTNEQLYFMVHQSLQELLSEHDVAAELHAIKDSPRIVQEFLCFRRRSKGDLIVAGNKIGGSAQRRRRNALLQHGSVLLRSSLSAPDLAGVEDLCEARINRAEFIDRWILKLENRLKIELTREYLNQNELDAAQKFKSTIYACDRWTNRR